MDGAAFANDWLGNVYDADRWIVDGFQPDPQTSTWSGQLQRSVQVRFVPLAFAHMSQFWPGQSLPIAS